MNDAQNKTWSLVLWRVWTKRVFQINPNHWFFFKMSSPKWDTEALSHLLYGSHVLWWSIFSFYITAIIFLIPRDAAAHLIKIRTYQCTSRAVKARLELEWKAIWYLKLYSIKGHRGRKTSQMETTLNTQAYPLCHVALGKEKSEETMHNYLFYSWCYLVSTGER